MSVTKTQEPVLPTYREVRHGTRHRAGKIVSNIYSILLATATLFWMYNAYDYTAMDNVFMGWSIVSGLELGYELIQFFIDSTDSITNKDLRRVCRVFFLVTAGTFFAKASTFFAGR